MKKSLHIPGFNVVPYTFLCLVKSIKCAVRASRDVGVASIDIDSIVYNSHRAALSNSQGVDSEPVLMEEEDGIKQDENDDIDEECEVMVSIIPVIYHEELYTLSRKAVMWD